MDNITHTLFAVALSKLPVGTRSPLSALALVAGANLPDLDAVAGLAGRDAYLLHHRGITHAIPGIVVQIVLLGWVFVFLERRFFGIPDKRAEPVGVLARILKFVSAPVVAAGAVGLASHPLLDALNSYGVRPWLPFLGTCYHGDMVFIIDPWLWLWFGAAAGVTGPFGKFERGVLCLSLVATTAVVYFNSRSPFFVKMVWPPALLIIFYFRWKGLLQKRAATVVFVMLTAALLYCAALWKLGSVALDRSVGDVAARLEPGEKIVRSSRNPEPANPLEWTTLVETTQFVHRRHMSLSGPNSVQFRIRTNASEPEVLRAASTPRGAVWHTFARHPVASVSRDEEGRTVVRLMDARFGVDPNLNWTTLDVVIEN